MPSAEEKRDENVFLRGSIWWIRYTCHGKQLRESSESELKQEALNLLKGREGEIVAGRSRGLSRVTVGELLDDVETDYRLNGLASLPKLRSRLKHLKPTFGRIRAVELSNQRIDAIVSTESRTVPSGQPSTAKCRSCRAPGISPYAGRRSRDNSTFHYSVKTTSALASYPTGSMKPCLCLPWYLKPLLINAYHVPCRFGELTNLLLNQLDFEHNEIVLNPGETKNRDGRHMPMIGPMRESLIMQKAIRDEKFPECPYVFFSEKGERIVDIRKAWKTACKVAGSAKTPCFTIYGAQPSATCAARTSPSTPS